jgi:cell division protein ZapA
MSGDGKGLSINLMGREFKVACADGEEKQLLASVDYVNQRIQEIKDSGKVVGTERIALIAALNITHELLIARTPKGFDTAELKRRIEALQATVDDALAEQDKLF